MKMNCTPILHATSAITGVLGLISLIGAWIAGSDGMVMGFDQAHLFNDAQSLFLASIAFGVGTMLHMKMGKK